MSDVTNEVQSHYSLGTILERIDANLEERGIDPAKITQDDLCPLDQLHGRGVTATMEHIEFAGIDSSMHVLDLGCGVGGSSRVIASTCGCTLSGIDLTSEFIEVARELTRRCGLADRVDLRQANALDLPFDDESFDHVWCHNVTMNIEDKTGLAAELARLLKPGGRFSCAELGLGSAGELSYPLPWARDESSSFLITPDEMRATLEGAGLRVIEKVDLTEVNLAFRKENQERTDRGDPPLMMNHVVMGDDALKRGQNLSRMAKEGRIIEHMILAEKS